MSSPDSAEFFGVLGATSPSTVRIASAESAGDDESIGGGPFSAPILYKVCLVFSNTKGICLALTVHPLFSTFGTA